MQVFSTSPLAVYSSVGNAFSRISSTEGVRALWRGVSSVILGAGPAHAIHFGTLEAVRELVGRWEDADGDGGGEVGKGWIATCKCWQLQEIGMGLIFGLIAAAGASATIASDAFMNPFDGTYPSAVHCTSH